LIIGDLTSTQAQQGIIGIVDKEKLLIHIPKNAGTTFQRPEFIGKIKLQSWSGHRHWRYVDRSKSFMDKFDTVAIVRNPWDRVVSRYFYAKKVIYEIEESFYYGYHNYVDLTSFEAFVEQRHLWGKPMKPKDLSSVHHLCSIRSWSPSFDFVVEDDGEVRSDILRFENFDEDINSYFGFTSNVEPMNVTENRCLCRDIYTPETIQIVADWYKQDIDHWGYDFDTGPTRNYWNA
jgi:hypothetical protein